MNQQIAIYCDLLADIKTRIRTAQHRAARSANAEMMHLYWDIGRLIAAKQEHAGWGTGVIPRLAVDLKKGDFKPEYAGKMNFYCSAVDAQLRHTGDAPTIGLILFQTKDRILAEYSRKDINKPIGVADYELTHALPAELASSLPSIETIEAELSVDLATEHAS